MLLQGLLKRVADEEHSYMCSKSAHAHQHFNPDLRSSFSSGSSSGGCSPNDAELQLPRFACPCLCTHAHAPPVVFSARPLVQHPYISSLALHTFTYSFTRSTHAFSPPHSIHALLPSRPCLPSPARTLRPPLPLQAKAAEARAATQACPPAAVSQGQAALRSRQEPQATSRQEPQAAPGTLQHPQAGSQQPWVAPHASAELQRSTGAWDALDASTGLQRSTSTSARQGLGGRTHRRAGSVGGSCGAGNGIGGAAIMPSSGTSSDSGMAGTAGPVTGMGVACLAQLPLDEASRHVPAPQLPLDEASRHAPALQLPLDEASRHVPSSQGLQGSGQQGAGCAMPLRGFDTDERTAALLGELYSAFGCGDLGAAP
eukprot:145219-Pelagomonas_calceolata.AAC.1